MQLNDWFTISRTEENIYCITEKHYHGRLRANCWLLYNNEHSVLIDCGLGIYSIRDFIEKQFATKKITAVATHCHFDHVGGLYEFEKSYAHTAEIDALKNGDAKIILSDPKLGYYNIADFAADVDKKIIENYSVAKCPKIMPLQDGEVLNISDWSLKVLYLPGHSAGSIALCDKKSGYLFCGDIVYRGELLDDLPGSDRRLYCESLKRLQEMNFTKAFPGHFEVLGYDEMVEIANSYLDKNEH